MAESLNLKNCLNLPDDFEGYDKDLFNLPPHYKSCVSRVLIPHGMIMDRIERLGVDILTDLKKDNITSVNMLCVLKGGYRFFSDLQDKMNLVNGLSVGSNSSVELLVDFIRTKSYENDASTGKVTITGLEKMEALRGRDVLVVEDIVDTGKTMVELLKVLKTYEPKSIRVACLVRKRTSKSNKFVPDFVCFEVPEKFVVGYAFDFNEYFRDMMHVCVMNAQGIEKYQV